MASLRLRSKNISKKYIHRIVLLKSIPQLIVAITISFFLIALMYILSNNSILRINQLLSADFFKLIAVLAGTMGAILIGFFIFQFQTIGSQRQNWYLAIKKEINMLVEILHNLPDKYAQLCDPLDKAIKYIEQIDIRTDPFTSKIDWETIERPTNLAFDDKSIDTTDKDVYKLIKSVVHIEEFFEELTILSIAAYIAGKLMIGCITKLFILLITSLTLISFFNLIDISLGDNMFIWISIVIFLNIYFILIILEVLLHIKDYYRNVTYHSKGKLKNMEEHA